MIKFNLGCGKDIKKEYINVDLFSIDPRVKKHNVENLDDIAINESVDEILALDVLEHISYNKTIDVLKNWYSKLRFGGKLIIQSPCIELICNRLISEIGREEIETMLARIFSIDDEGMHHRTALSLRTIEIYLKEAGFKNKAILETNFGNGTNLKVTIIK